MALLISHTCYSAATFILYLQESVVVNIEVRQTNYPPTFYSSYYFATIPEDWEVGRIVIASIEAVDFDQV